MQMQIQIQMFQFSLQYCQDSVAGPKQTWHSAKGKAQLEIAPCTIAHLVHSAVSETSAMHRQKLVYSAMSEAHHGNACGAAAMHLVQCLLLW